MARNIPKNAVRSIAEADIPRDTARRISDYDFDCHNHRRNYRRWLIVHRPSLESAKKDYTRLFVRTDYVARRKVGATSKEHRRCERSKGPRLVLPTSKSYGINRIDGYLMIVPLVTVFPGGFERPLRSSQLIRRATELRGRAVRPLSSNWIIQVRRVVGILRITG